MGRKSKATDSGPMDKFVKKKRGDQNEERSQLPNLQADKLQAKTGDQKGERSQPPDLQADNLQAKTGDQKGERSQPPDLQADNLQAKEVEPHETHSLVWCLPEKKPETITCNKARTVEDLLKRSSQFMQIAKKNKNKELVIVRDGKAISTHFPCCLVKAERLTVRYVKAGGNANQQASGSGLPQRKKPSGELVMFHVLTKGGKKVVRILTNPALHRDMQLNEITVYAYKGETVRQALKRDGRLSRTIFQKNCALSCKITDMPLSNLVDDLDGETVKIILRNWSGPPESQPGSLDDAYEGQNESQKSDPDENQDPPQQSTTAESVNGKKTKVKPEQNDVMATLKIIDEIPNSKRMRSNLSSQFKDVVNSMKNQCVSKLSHIQNLFRVEYGKNAQTCSEVKTMKILMQLSASVCQVRINGSPGGSGFLLFDKFVLTNHHVIKDIYNESTGQLGGAVTVHFSFESLEKMEGELELGGKVVVEEVVGSEYYPDESGDMCDWALLRLRADQTLPDGLLPHFGFLLQCSGICIIGHPDGGVKKIDPCFIIPSDNRRQIVERHYHEKDNEYFQMVTDNFFMDVLESVKHNRLTYESCFYFRSSGSPVFDKYCNVIAMHTGGYSYHDPSGKSQSVIEYGQPLSIIIEHIIIKMVEREKHDVVKEYLACDYDQHQNMMTNVKKLVESRNRIAFKDAVNKAVVAGDEKLKPFFEFFSQRKDPVPMVTD